MMSFLSEKQPEILKSLTQNIDPKGELVKVLIANTKVPESKNIRTLDSDIPLNPAVEPRPMDDPNLDFISKLDQYHKNLLYPHPGDNDIITNEILPNEKPEIVRTQILTVHAHTPNQNDPERNRVSGDPQWNPPPPSPLPFNQPNRDPAQFHPPQQIPIHPSQRNPIPINPTQRNVIPLNRENNPQLIPLRQNIIPLNNPNNQIPLNPFQNPIIQPNSYEQNPFQFVPHAQPNQVPLNPSQRNHIIQSHSFQQNQIPLNPSQRNHIIQSHSLIQQNQIPVNPLQQNHIYPDSFQQNQISPLNPAQQNYQPNSFQGNPIPFDLTQQNPLMPDLSQQINIHPHSILHVQNPSNPNFDPQVLQELQMAPPHVQEALLQQVLMEQNMNEHNLPRNHIQMDQQMQNQISNGNQNHMDLNSKNAAVKILGNPKQTAGDTDKIADENHEHAVKQRQLIVPHHYYYYQ